MFLTFLSIGKISDSQQKISSVFSMYQIGCGCRISIYKSPRYISLWIPLTFECSNVPVCLLNTRVKALQLSFYQFYGLNLKISIYFSDIIEKYLFLRFITFQKLINRVNGRNKDHQPEKAE